MIRLGRCVPIAFLILAYSQWSFISGEESSASAPSQDQVAVRCLIVTGEDYPGHKWQETTPVLKSALERQGRIKVDVAEDIKVLRTGRLMDYDVLVMHFKNYDPTVPGREGLEQLAKFVQQGGGVVLVHFACGAFQEFKDDFVKIAGRVWNPQLRGHDPHGTFTVRIVDPEHPISHGMKDFETVDELYTCLDGDIPIHLIAVARSKVDGRDYPMAFVLEVGQGRVFHCVLGHNPQAFAAPQVQQLFERGCLWAAHKL
ncbi:MAG: ThuA domain-containing protein [Thermogutta sp.]